MTFVGWEFCGSQWLIICRKASHALYWSFHLIVTFLKIFWEWSCPPIEIISLEHFLKLCVDISYFHRFFYIYKFLVLVNFSTLHSCLHPHYSLLLVFSPPLSFHMCPTILPYVFFLKVSLWSNKLPYGFSYHFPKINPSLHFLIFPKLPWPSLIKPFYPSIPPYYLYFTYNLLSHLS